LKGIFIIMLTNIHPLFMLAGNKVDVTVTVKNNTVTATLKYRDQKGHLHTQQGPVHIGGSNKSPCRFNDHNDNAESFELQVEGNPGDYDLKGASVSKGLVRDKPDSDPKSEDK
jgi:hypothetical protein